MKSLYMIMTLNELLLEAGERHAKNDDKDPIYNITTGKCGGITFQRDGEGAGWDWLERARDAALEEGFYNCTVKNTDRGLEVLFSQ